MLRFLLKRPIAIIMITVAALAASIIAFYNLPVSLLPPIDVPEITISTYSPNGSPEDIEEDILKPIRESVLTIDGLKNSESIAQNEIGTVSLKFDYKTSMNLAYIEVNEKIDRLASILPRNIERPIVIKSSISDIPVVRLQVTPLHGSDIIGLSDFSMKVLKRRLEQIDGVGLVDINGLQRNLISITPNYDKLRSLKLSEKDLTKSIQEANLDLGSLSVKDGNYRYFLKLASRLTNPEEIKELPIILPGNSGAVKLEQVATVSFEAEKTLGFHLFDTKRGVVITVHKQAQARMHELMPTLYKAIDQFKTDYPQVNFEPTQDQSLLLTLSIENLSQALLWGGIFAFAVLFIFMRGWREPLIMGIVLPISLVLSFSIFHLLNLSLNIISLSGLALGLGMLVDNSIVVIDNIILKRKEGENLIESCVIGTQEVIVPLLSSTLTNLAVFLPLIFLSGLTGALFYDQALSIMAILSVSMLCTFILVPLLYYLFFKNQPFELKNDSRIFLFLKKGYSSSLKYVWKKKKTSLCLLMLLFPIAIALIFLLPKQGFPDLERTETIITIEWNEPIDANECGKRVVEFLNDNALIIEQSESEIGFQQFILNTQKQSVQHANIYLSFTSQDKKLKADKVLDDYLSKRFPLASVEFSTAPNAFEQIFSSNLPLFEARFHNTKSINASKLDLNDSIFQKIKYRYNPKFGKGFEMETMAFIRVDFNKISNYGISYFDVVEQLKIAFGTYSIVNFKHFGEVTQVVFGQKAGDLEHVLNGLEIKSTFGVNYPIRDLVSIDFKENYKNITADASGIYQSIYFNELENREEIESELTSLASSKSFLVNFKGQWYENKETYNEIILILMVSLLLMYFILTAEFESLSQPILVMLTVPMGFAGSLIFLWILGGSLNIMSGIGLVVVLGILDNDAILKIDRINRLRKHLPLEKAIMQAGSDRLKPIVMNTCTNILALSPILFSSGLGADLQRPVAITSIGGLIVGTLTALYFVPLMYWYLYRSRNTQLDQ